ncbi:MAG: adenosylmethionine--8-amino-7-oxononanoate transaminase [Candidatus Omnitrophota bacterium]
MNSWIRRDLKNIWHPYTQMKDCRKFPPILIDRARGIRLYDSDGNSYYDTISSWWCNVHGHNHPVIKRAVTKQLNKLEHVLFAGFTHKSAIELAEQLVAIAPKGLTKVFFSDNGSTAVETALKISYQYWKNIGRRKKSSFVCLDHGYHGDTIGSMSVSGVGLFNKVFKGLFFDSYKVPSPYCYRCPMGKERSSCSIECARPLEKLLKKRHGSIAALIIEPMIMAAGGMITYPSGYLRAVRRLTKRYGVHLICDEVATGFGRTGRMFACEHAGVAPDLLCLSKGITAGYLPMGATLAREAIYRAFYADLEKNKTFYHGHTFTANPLACSAALASLSVFRKEKTLQRMKELIPIFRDGLESMRGLRHVGDVRSIGLIGALELVKDKATKEPFGISERLGMKIYRKGLKKGLILRPLGNIVYLFLPLCVKKSELKYILESTRSIIAEI